MFLEYSVSGGYLYDVREFFLVLLSDDLVAPQGLVFFMRLNGYIG
jgi:hypothetical protein